MGRAPQMVSIGDDGILNTRIAPSLSDVWIDRDLSWLDFNQRVLAEALDERTPLLERAKFLAIFASNLDEFFMKRIAVLRSAKSPERHELLRQIREKLLPMIQQQADCFSKKIVLTLAEHGIFLRHWEDLTPGQQSEANQYFDESVSPALTPLVIESQQAFPFLSNLSTSLIFSLYDPAQQEMMYGRVKVPSGLKQWVPLKADLEPRQQLLVPLYDVIRGNLGKLYAGMETGVTTLVRLTRDAEVELDDELPGALPDLVREQVRQRRYEPVIRLEFGPGSDANIREMLCQRFELTPLDIYEMPTEVDFTTLFEIGGINLLQLSIPEWNPLTPLALQDESTDIFAILRAGDMLVHHPYDSFDATVEHFVATAADDPHTLSIKMTAYRIGDDTPFVKSLIRAAESGKQVACVIEIKARFDEERNLHWASELEKAGAHVTFGVRGLKTHAKLILVVRKEHTGLRTYMHVGTGNYHVRTARLYTDVGLLTCDPILTSEGVALFHYLTGHSKAPEYASLVVAPTTMRQRFLELVKRETENHRAGLPARIVAKMNQLEDPEIIEALCEAASAGVPIDLVVRGFCCLKPGVPGRSEGIRIRSIIGRFLEHSRIFHFANGQEDPVEGDFFISSADWMHRNLSKRIEVATPIVTRAHKERLWEFLEICLRDRRQAWALDSNGEYNRLYPEGQSDGPEAIGTHQMMMELTRNRAGEGEP
jgi:polyphosphate kinase